MEQINKYPGLINGFDLPNPVPNDLLIPWSAFIEKYGLQALAPIVFGLEEGYAPLLDLPTLFIMKQFTPDIIKDIQTGFLTTKDRDNHEIYERAQAVLQKGNNVLRSATIVAMNRNSPDYVRIVVKTSSGLKLIQAKKVVFAIPPHVPAISPFFDFDAL